MVDLQTGYAASGDARIYYETVGSGPGFVMIHAGVADHRQWNAAFEHFGQTHQVLGYDMRGHGKSDPVAGSYCAIDDLLAVLAAADMRGPKIMMGCSMGGALAMDFTLAHPREGSALIMVCAGPSGLSLDVERPAKFAEIEAADAAGDLDLVCELETQVWFDGEGRAPGDVDAAPRALLYEMNRLALTHESKDLGKREHDLTPPACERLGEISVPVMLLTGAFDVPFMAAAADYMCDAMPHAQRVDYPDTAHLPNMEHPHRFNLSVEDFLADIAR